MKKMGDPRKIDQSPEWAKTLTEAFTKGLVARNKSNTETETEAEGVQIREFVTAIKESGLSRSDLASALEELSRRPFRLLLEDFIFSAPDRDSIQKFANRAPDRWANALSAVARLSGYKDEIDITQNIHHQISQMSDADLLEHLRNAERDAQEAGLIKVIEG